MSEQNQNARTGQERDESDDPELELKRAWDDENHPMWDGIPKELIRRVGQADKDTAGGCG